MLESLLKLISEQAWGSRPALERPITHLKYGVFGALSAGLITFLGIAVLGAALYLWLVASGLVPFAALVVVAVMLIMAAGLCWGFSSRLMKAELERQEMEHRQQEEAAGQNGQLPELLVTLLQDTAVSFLEGISEPGRCPTETPKAVRPAQHTETCDKVG